jgi:hypothetical protein
MFGDTGLVSRDAWDSFPPPTYGPWIQALEVEECSGFGGRIVKKKKKKNQTSFLSPGTEHSPAETPNHN